MARLANGMIDLRYSNGDAAGLCEALTAKGMTNVECSITLDNEGGCSILFSYNDLMGDRTSKAFSRWSYHGSNRENALTQACHWIFELPEPEEGLAAMKRAKILEAVETLESLGVDEESVNAIKTIAEKLSTNALTYRS